MALVAALAATALGSQLVPDVLDTINREVSASRIQRAVRARSTPERRGYLATRSNQGHGTFGGVPVLQNYNQLIGFRSDLRVNPFSLQSGFRQDHYIAQHSGSGYFKTGWYSGSPYAWGFGQIRGPRGR